MNSTDGTQIGTILIYDMNGKEIHTSTVAAASDSIDLNDVTAGVYFLKHDGGTEKFVIGQ